MKKVEITERLVSMADAVDRTIESYLSGFVEPKKLYRAVSHLPLAGGKRLRPIMAMLGCEAAGGNAEKALQFGVALELLHTFTLVHDDIMDGAETRRNRQTVHRAYGANTAILAGDVLLAQAMELASGMECDSITRCELMGEIATLTREICEGQQRDMEFESCMRISEDEYLTMVRMKTAIIFETALRGGALIGSADAEYVNALSDYGINFGMAFQLWDDYLDLFGNERSVGKSKGGDIRNGKKTLMAVHATSSLAGDELGLFESLLGKKEATDGEVETAIKLLEKSGSVEYAKQSARMFAESAARSLEPLENNTAKQILIHLANYAVDRKN
ncbi:MAG: polyprenyl synthetase family protein [Thermoplasmata archaeon HGW-Thermoplasmata-1]|nr:MAG: polyprenyl synthetase family protein [Thermoplasmata archaeon HGW-Thermoplasmata-1]